MIPYEIGMITLTRGNRITTVSVPMDYLEKIWTDMPPPYEYRSKATDKQVPQGARLKTIREQHGLTQAELAVKIKIPRSSIALMEIGKRTITKRFAATFAKFFDVDPSEFL